MPPLKNTQELKGFVEAMRAGRIRQAMQFTTITVGVGTCGIAAGAKETMDAIAREIKSRGLSVLLRSTGCIGVCVREPLVDVQLPGMARVLYANVQPDMVRRIIEEHVIGRHPVRDWLVGSLSPEDPRDRAGRAALEGSAAVFKADAHRHAQLRNHRPGAA